MRGRILRCRPVDRPLWLTEHPCRAQGRSRCSCRLQAGGAIDAGEQHKKRRRAEQCGDDHARGHGDGERRFGEPAVQGGWSEPAVGRGCDLHPDLGGHDLPGHGAGCLVAQDRGLGHRGSLAHRVDAGCLEHGTGSTTTEASHSPLGPRVPTRVQPIVATLSSFTCYFKSLQSNAVGREASEGRARARGGASPFSQSIFERFSRSSPTECLSRSAVDCGSHSIKFSFLIPTEVGAFRKILSQQAICIFICTSLPGASRITEVDLQPSIDTKLCMLGQFRALVPRQRSSQLCR